MPLKHKTTEWLQAHVIDEQTAQSILAYEARKRTPFGLLGVLWFGLMCFGLGVISLITHYWGVIPPAVKLTGAGLGLCAAVSGAFYWLRREQHTLAEVALFIAFLMIGVCIGLIAQIFNLPFETETGLLLWAFLSFGLVLLSRRPLLMHLWVPLFLGGILGYVKLEFLFLFFAQMPFLTTLTAATGLFALIWLSDKIPTAFMRGVAHWSTALYFLVLFLGDDGIRNPWLGFLMTGGFLGLLAAYALYRQKTRLFNLVLFLLAARFILLYFQVFEAWTSLALTLIPIGLGLSAAAYLMYRKQTRA